MPVQYKDYYQILGVPKTAPVEEIRKAYRKLARRYHPDVSKDPEAEQRFKEVNEAYQVLSDPEKRRRYDQLGANWQQYEQWQQQGGGRGFEWVFTGPGGVFFGDGGDFAEEELGGFSDFFRMFFGDLAGRSATRTRARVAGRAGADLEQPLEITLQEACRGVERALEASDRNDPARRRRLTVNIPAGVRDGQRIRLAGQGAPGSAGGPAGDLYLVVRVKEHPFFHREGDDIHIELPVSLNEALLGAEVTLPTLKGRVTLKMPPETQNGRVIRLAGQGMPRLGAGGYGDLFVKVKVVLPQKLSEAERQLVKKLMDAHREDVRGHLL